MPKGRPAGSVSFKDIPEETRTAIDQSSPEAICARLAQVTKDEELNQLAKKEDAKILDAKDELKKLGLGYKEVSRLNKLTIKYMLKALKEKGKL